MNGTPSQEEPHAKQGALDMPLVHDANYLCNDRQLEAARLEELYSPDLKLLSLTAGAVEKLNLGGIPGHRGFGADPLHEQRARFFEAPWVSPTRGCEALPLLASGDLVGSRMYRR